MLHNVEENAGTSTPSPLTLSVAVTRRRTELRLTKAALARQAQITRSTLHEIENGTRKNIQPATARALEKALRMAPGSLARLMSSAADEAGGHVPPTFIDGSSRDEQLAALAMELIAMSKELRSERDSNRSLRERLRALEVS